MRCVVTPTVVRILSRDERAREDDNYLFLMFCREMGLTDYEPLPPNFPKIGSIVRIRARLQAQGRFRPREAVWHRRQRNRRKEKI